MRLLDLFAGAGGCGEGYARAGFEVVGVDIKPQPRNPHECHVGDALAVLDALLAGERWQGYALGDFAAIHASPPCQGYSIAGNIHPRDHPMLIEDVRGHLEATGMPWIIENVFGARSHMPGNILLCGTHFGLKVYRHRLFESSMLLFSPGPCTHPAWLLPGYVSIFGGSAKSRQKGNKGNDYKRFPVAYSREAMGIDWMSRDELSQAIPSAYTEWLGRQLLAAIQAT